MKDFVQRVQKEFKVLQKMFETEGNDLVKKIKVMTQKKNIDATKKQIEKLIESKLKKLEPALRNLVKEVKTTAVKAGVDFGGIEDMIMRAPGAKAAKKRVDSVVKGFTAKKAKKKAKKKAASKKTTGKKETAKKAKSAASPARKAARKTASRKPADVDNSES